MMLPVLYTNQPWSPANLFDLLFTGSPACCSPELYPLPIEIVREGDTYRLTAPVPGMTAKDIQITLDQQVLTIQGEFQRPAVRENSRLLVNERCYGQFSRSIRLPSSIDADRIQATVSDGILTVELPIEEKSKPLTIPIKST